MDQELRVLILEGTEAAGAAIERALLEARLAFRARHVASREALEAELAGEPPEVVIGDHCVPGLEGEEALALIAERAPGVPVIIVTSSADEDAGVRCLKAGAADYLHLDRLARLAPALLGALENQRVRSEKERAERSLRRREELFRSLVENSLDIITIVDQAGSVRYVSPSIQRLLGFSPTERIGRTPFELVHPEDEPRLRRAFASVVATPGQALIAEFRLKDSEGRWRHFESTGAHVPDVAGTPGVILSSRDVTRRKRTEEALRRTEEELRQAQKLDSMGKLASGIAHDFSNLLTAIMGYNDLMLLRMPPDDPLRAYADEIAGVAARGMALTGRLLTYGRKQRLELRVLDLSALVADVHGILSRLIGEDIELVSKLAPGLWRIRADPSQMQQILLNLAANARDAMPGGGRLTIETRNLGVEESEGTRSEPQVSLVVEDTGLGMDEATRARLFEPFFTTKPEAAGLGLSSVYGIVTQCGGRISATSEPGRGTRFEIVLPRCDEPEAALEGSAARPPSSALEPGPATTRGAETLLVVEDDAVLRQMLAEVLRAQGYRVLHAADGEEAERFVSSRPETIDLLLTDVVMPRLGGQQLAERARRLRPGIRVLFISGYAEGRLAAADLAVPGTAALAKPFSPSRMVQEVRMLLDRPLEPAASSASDQRKEESA